MTPELDLRLADLPPEQRHEAQYRMRCFEAHAKYQRACAVARERWEQERAACWLRGEPEAVPPLNLPEPPLILRTAPRAIRDAHERRRYY